MERISGRRIAVIIFCLIACTAAAQEPKPKPGFPLFWQQFKWHESQRIEQQTNELRESMQAQKVLLIEKIDSLKMLNSEHLDAHLALLARLETQFEKYDALLASILKKQQAAGTDPGPRPIVYQLPPLPPPQISFSTPFSLEPGNLKKLDEVRQHMGPTAGGRAATGKAGPSGWLERKGDVVAFLNPNIQYDTSGFSTLFPATARLFSLIVYDAGVVDGYTGDLLNRGDKNVYKALGTVRASGYTALLTCRLVNDNPAHPFLHNEGAKEVSIRQMTDAARGQVVDGVNISIPNLSNADRGYFLDYIKDLANQLRPINPRFKIAVTLPAGGDGRAYDFVALDPNVSLYFVEFSNNPSETSARSGFRNTSLIERVSPYLNQQLPSSKLIVKLPYDGIFWESCSKPGKDALGYISYQNLLSLPWPRRYDSASFNYVMELVDSLKGCRSTIWFDNDETLAAKFDFVQKSNLRGVAFSYPQVDVHFDAIRNALLSAFFSVQEKGQDTVQRGTFNWWQRLKRRLSLYYYIVDNPCVVCFECDARGIGSSEIESRNRFGQYLIDLRIDSIVRAKNPDMEYIIESRNQSIDSLILASTTGSGAWASAEDTLKIERWDEASFISTEEFTYLNNELTRLMLIVTIFFLVLIVAGVIYYINRLRLKGKNWKYKRAAEWASIGLAVLFVWSLFAYLFTSDDVPLFGVNSSNKVLVLSSANAGAGQDCINMPLLTLQIIILVSGAIGMVLMKYLIIPMIRKEEVP